MKPIDFRQRIKKNKRIYFFFKKISDKDYLRNYFEFLFTTSHKGKNKISEELLLIKRYWNCDPMHYFRYKLYKKDLSEKELLDYIPPYYFYNFYMPTIYKNVDLSKIEDKILAHKFFTERMIPTAMAVAFVNNQSILDCNYNQISINELIGILKTSLVERFFVKPVDGRGGKGIFVITKKDDNLKINGIHLSKEKLQKKFRSNNYIIQEEIVQRSDLNAINGSSVNTLRVITQISGNKSHIAAAVLRMGRNSAFVDNSAQGGISAEINLETGKLNKYAFTEHDMQIFERHPDSKIVFDDFLIVDWPDIKDKICEYADKIMEYNEIAWDIAIGTDKVFVIEVNAFYGLDHLQCCIGGMRGKLNFPVKVS